MTTLVRAALQDLSPQRIRQHLFYLAGDLPRRTVHSKRPGQERSTLEEADAYLLDQLRSAGLAPTITNHQVQPFRCDRDKPMHHWYAPPRPDDPWFSAANLEAQVAGAELPGEIVQLLAHKDSQSWIASPGAYDNAAGTAALLEIARVLATRTQGRTIRMLFCNEEHAPWTSRFAAEAAARRDDRIVAVLNVDSLGGGIPDVASRGRHAVCHSTPEGEALARKVAGCAARYRINLDVELVAKETIGDDEGMFIKAGFRSAVMNIGSWPYADPQYHLPGDSPERVDIENVTAGARLVLAATLELAAGGSL